MRNETHSRNRNISSYNLVSRCLNTRYAFAKQWPKHRRGCRVGARFAMASSLVEQLSFGTVNRVTCLAPHLASLTSRGALGKPRSPAPVERPSAESIEQRRLEAEATQLKEEIARCRSENGTWHLPLISEERLTECKLAIVDDEHDELRQTLLLFLIRILDKKVKHGSFLFLSPTRSC